ncbi:MAG: ATP-binding protein [Dehalococcoidia bacterium]
MANDQQAPSNLEDLVRIVRERLEETTRLEFKRQLPESGKNDDLAKDLAAMANTEGGVIIYGIEEDKEGRATGLYSFPTSGAGERVALVAQTLDEPIRLGSIDSIASQEKRKGFLVVQVPKSDRAPHLHKGTAYGRTSKGITTLTRRQVGELFARSSGFAQEFGLVLGRPGRLFVRPVSEPYQETDSRGQLRTRRRHSVLFENDGETDVFDARWEWVTAPGTEDQMPDVVEDPFPLEVVQPGIQVRISVSLYIGSASNLRIRTRWRDQNQQEYEQNWPVTW